MATPLKEWSKSIKPMMDYADNNIEKMWTETFLRDPFRGFVIDPNAFYTPADGIIIYSDICKPTEKVVEIKGMTYTLQDMMDDENFNQTCLVIGVFMTYFDVHVNRCPTGGMLSYKQLTATNSYNRPMIFAEQDLEDLDIVKLYRNMHYVKTNTRMLNTIYMPSMDYTYYVTQIADSEVNVITHFATKQKSWFDQNDRFSFVRWGSQVELILPIDKRFKFKTLHPILTHVEGAHDKLVLVQ
jgi:phosphatidylserine decarboxylase